MSQSEKNLLPSKDLQYTITTSYTLCSTTATIPLPSTNRLFLAQHPPPPSCRTAEAEVKTLSSVSGLTRFDWTAFELHWQSWRHSFHHWGHHDPFHARQMLNTSRHRVDTESLSIQRAGLWHQQYAHRGWR